MNIKLPKMMLFSAVSALSTEAVSTVSNAETTSVESKKPAAAAAKSTPGKEKLLNSKTKVLSNGLRVIVVEDHTVPRVSTGVLYGVGCADDPDDLRGLSHMAEHMFFHVSSLPDYDSKVENHGGYTNAFTTEDGTFYQVDAPAIHLAKMLEMDAVRMKSFVLDNEKVFLSERNSVAEERRMRVDNVPLASEVGEYITRMIWPQHPYGLGWAIIGHPHQIAAYTREAIMEHYRKWYKPNNATLIVVGDVKAENVFALSQKLFGPIPRGNVPERFRMPNKIQSDISQDITYYTNYLAAPKIKLFYRPPYHRVDGVEACIALQIGLEALFSGPVFKFARYFIDKKQLISAFNVSYDIQLDPSPFSVEVPLLPGVNVKSFLRHFHKKIAQVLKNGLDPEDFRLAKKASITAAVYADSDGHRKMRDAVAVALSQGLSLETIENTPQILEGITLENVNFQLRKAFGEKPLATVRLLPKSQQK